MSKAGYVIFFPLFLFGLGIIVLAINGTDLMKSVIIIDERGNTVPMSVAFLVLCVIFGYILWECIGKPAEEDKMRKEKERELMKIAERKKRDLEQENLRREQETKERKEAMERATAPLLRRIKKVLRNNAGEYFTEMDLHSEININTANEDNYFDSALRSLPYNEGFRIKRIKGMYYYYYVEPD